MAPNCSVINRNFLDQIVDFVKAQRELADISSKTGEDGEANVKFHQTSIRRQLKVKYDANGVRMKVAVVRHGRGNVTEIATKCSLTFTVCFYA